MNDPKYNQPMFGQAPFGEPPFAQPPQGQQPYGQKPYGQPDAAPAGERQAGPMSSIERAVRAFDRQEFVPPSPPGDMLPHALNSGYGAGGSQPPQHHAPFGQPPMGQPSMGAPASWQVQPAQIPPAQFQPGQFQPGQFQPGQAPFGAPPLDAHQPMPAQSWPGQPAGGHHAPAPGMNPAAAPYPQPAAGAPFGRLGPAAYGQPPQGAMPSFGHPAGDHAGMTATPGFPGLNDRGPSERGQAFPAPAHPGLAQPGQAQPGWGGYAGQALGHNPAIGQHGNPAAAAPHASARAPGRTQSYYPIDRRRLSELGMLGTEAAAPGQVEEFRIVKRQIIEQADDMRRRGGGGAAQRVMVCSAHAGEGKTFCAVNLAMSISAEKESEVLLVDFDLARASVLQLLGLPPGPGLMEAIVDHTVDVRKLVMATDIPGLSVLPGGRPTNSDTEYLASSRAAQVLDMLTEDAPQRIVLFDSPPALAASIPAEVAKLMGQVVLVVLADSTSSGAIQDAASLLAGCPNVQLLLNSVQFSPNGRRFGSYHGYRG